MKTSKEILEVLEMFNEFQLKPRLLNKYQVENHHTFDVVDTVTIEFDEVNNFVIFNNQTLSKSDTLSIIGKFAPDPLVEVYDVIDTEGKLSKYVLSHFPNKDVLVYFLQYGESKTQAWSSLHKN